MSRPTDLEQAVLGLIWAEGPLTPYALRHFFLDSPTPAWSGSAGTIYPLVRRLEDQGMLHSEEVAEDGRGTRRYSITAEGEAQLRAWLRAPLPRDAVAISPDPVRTRISFLSVLPPEERVAFLEATEAQMREAQSELRKHASEVERSDNLDEEYATLGAVAAMRARLRWIRDLLERERSGAPLKH